MLQCYILIIVLFLLFFYVNNIEKLENKNSNQIKGYNSNNFKNIDLHPDNSYNFNLQIISNNEKKNMRNDIDLNFLENKFRPPNIFYSVPFQNIEINNYNYIVYDKIKKFIISNINKDSKYNYKIISNKLFKVMKNKFCYKYDFRITINYLKPIFIYLV